MTKHAKGTFEVKLEPQVDDKVGEPTVGRLSIDKQFHGDLEGTSKGQMLAVSTEVKGSAGYVGWSELMESWKVAAAPSHCNTAAP